ncbi:MAG: hypothetical protein ACQEVA_00420 [Myxococcota bacterium]
MTRFLPIFFAIALSASSCIFQSGDGESDTGADAGNDVQSDTSLDTSPDAEADADDDAGDTEEADADTGLECTAPAEPCGDQCIDTTSSNEHCGACDNPCGTSSDGYIETCVESMCEATTDCAEGFVDLDGDASNGCECEITDPNDPPGDDIDANCDGIDGDASTALFVREGASGNGLTADDPMGSLSDALNDAAADESLTQILIAQGSYPPFSLVSDVTVVGGYSGDFQEYDPSSYQTTIERSDDASGAGDLQTVEAVDIDNTVLASVRVIAAEAVDPGASTVAVYAQNSTFELRELTLEGGRAARGEDGESVSGPVSCDKPAGGGGGMPDGVNGCNLQTTTRTAPPGNPGEPGPPLGGSGGEGGYQSCETKSNCTNTRMIGRPGEDGAVPQNTGTNGMAPTNGAGILDNGSWTPATGTAPTAGIDGGAGGGGGAGANCGTSSSTYDTGGDGGRGGDGGCGGKPGENGQSGGASFLILSIGSDIELDGVMGVPGRGGDGGKGSPGTAGGPGTAGQAGADAPGGDGGPGGDGKAGSDGGDGAGGCGGPSYGVAFDSSSTINGDVNVDGATFEAGQPGSGATNNAPDGCDGVAAAEQEL